ncbi:hypothetical protein [Streptomyces sp. SD31]|uniref:hypothetical protein n=1 Tax=Streptomyces sp. SD31 TaxID=3452208 RepID=UPI003F88C69B
MSPHRTERSTTALDTAIRGDPPHCVSCCKRGETEVDGKPTITLTKEEDGATTNTYVATEDEPYILRVVTKGGGEPGDLTLTDYDKPVSATAPSSEDVVAVEELEQLGGAS